MKTRAFRNMALIATGVMMAAITSTAGTRGNNSQFRHDRERETVIAALQPVGAATGWGRVKVEREADGKQEFKTMASGLSPGSSYTIEADAFAAGIVTADAVGQASLELEHPDDENPLPPEMQPVEDLRLVEWKDDQGVTVLAGSFTGVSGSGGG